MESGSTRTVTSAKNRNLKKSLYKNAQPSFTITAFIPTTQAS